MVITQPLVARHFFSASPSPPTSLAFPSVERFEAFERAPFRSYLSGRADELPRTIMLNRDGIETTSVEGIISLLDTDLYKLTMQCAVLESYPDVGLYTSRQKPVERELTMDFEQT